MTFDLVHLYRTPDNNSESSSSQATTSTTTEQQVAADNGGIAIGAGASYVNEFSPDVANSVNKIVDTAFNFAQGVARTAGTITATEQATAAGAVAAAQMTAQQALNNTQLGQSSLFTNPATIFGIVATVGIIAFLIVKKRG